MKTKELEKFINHIKEIKTSCDLVQQKINNSFRRFDSFYYRKIVDCRTYLLSKQSMIDLENEILKNLNNYANNPALFIHMIIGRLSDIKLSFTVNKYKKKKSIETVLSTGSTADILGCIIYIYSRISSHYDLIDQIDQRLFFTPYLLLDSYNKFFHLVANNCKLIGFDILPILEKNDIIVYKYNNLDMYQSNAIYYNSFGHVIRANIFTPSGKSKSIKPDILKRNNTKELNTPKAKELLDKAVEYNLLENDYKWSKRLMTKRELAYLCYVLSNKLELSGILSKTDEGRYETKWGPFKQLFNESNLNNNLRGITAEDELTETMKRIKDLYSF